MAYLDELTGAPETATIGGVKYSLSPLAIDDWAVIQKRIIARRPDPIEAATRLAAGAPEAVAREILMKAYGDAQRSDIVTTEELDAWRFSYEGAQCQFFLAIRKNHPEITEDRAAALLEMYGREYLAEVTAQLQERFPEATEETVAAMIAGQERSMLHSVVSSISGLPRGNPQSPPETAGQSIGTASSSPSGNDTDGHTSKSES